MSRLARPRWCQTDIVCIATSVIPRRRRSTTRQTGKSSGGVCGGGIEDGGGGGEGDGAVTELPLSRRVRQYTSLVQRLKSKHIFEGRYK